jgi:hypothetical protein
MTTRIALLAATAAVAAPVAVAAAQTSPPALHLQSVQKQAFLPKHFRAGETAEFVDALSGDDRGTARIVCAVVGAGGLPCTIYIQLSKGTLTAQGVLPQRAKSTPVAITGGTGAYDGARGTALATDDSPTRSHIDIELRS